ncbi:MAG: TM0996/MTH895 family glutaredoxin-like protein [Bacteroidetes bacterium]|nr:TM0996/MTH895 family glutaredoxin-like protein [Bacteroidota bacterium]
MLDIKVLGSGCPNCLKVESIVREVLAEKKLEANIEKVTDRNRFLDFGLMMTPGLWVNGKLVSSGKIPAKSSVEQWILEAVK